MLQATWQQKLMLNILLQQIHSSVTFKIKIVSIDRSTSGVIPINVENFIFRRHISRVPSFEGIHWWWCPRSRSWWVGARCLLVHTQNVWILGRVSSRPFVWWICRCQWNGGRLLRLQLLLVLHWRLGSKRFYFRGCYD